MMKIFESQLRHLINILLIEAKADVLAARYPHIPVRTLDDLAVLDPSPSKKYLEWMVKVVDSGETDDLKKLGSTIHEFDSAVQRLRGPQRDINTYKSLRDLQTKLNDIGTQSKTKQKQTAKASGSQHVGTVDEWDVYFITSHQAAMLLGKGTKWCITQEDGTHWDEYVQRVKFFYAIRKQPKGDSFDKIAYACYLTNNSIEIFDAQDKSIYENDDSIIELSNFINHTKNRYNTYTVTSKNQTLEVINNEWSDCLTNDDGDKQWYRNGRLHREDGPAIERADGSKLWYLNGKLHREDGPAIEYENGDKEWLLNGKRHRDVGPAVEGANGDKEWWLNGKRHREGGPAVEFTYGRKEWWLNGERHREGGPAVEWAYGDKSWWLNGKLHREGGPAVEGADGRKEWWLNSKLHREGGPAVEGADGHKEWWLKGKRHREGGPAVEGANGHKEWWLKGKCHREGGPAVEWADGDKEWWLKGKRYNTEVGYKRALASL